MSISAENVKKLREKTGAGIMDCKRALKEAEGDFARSEEILKELGLAAVARRSGRATEEGRIFTSVSAGSAGIMEISCETDFVARNEDFARTGAELMKTADSMNESELSERINELAAIMKENISLRRLEIVQLKDNQLAADYVHGDAGSLGVLVVLELSPATLKTEEVVLNLGKDLAMHAAAFSPLYLNEEAVDSSYLADQEKIFKVQAEQLNKPANVLEGIIRGKLQKHLKEICFTKQGFVRDEKLSVAELLENTAKAVGGEIHLVDYRVFRAGEELS